MSKFSRTQIGAWSMLNSNIYRSLIFSQHNLFSNRFRANGPQRHEEFGSLEKEINSKFDVKDEPATSPNSMRCGAIGYKIGMTTIFDKWGIAIPCTVIQLDRCQVVQIKKNVNDKGMNTIQIGAGEGNLKLVTKSQLGHFMKAGVPVKKDCAEFRVTDENLLPIGYMIGPSHFHIGNFIDVKGVSKGKGFLSVINRWNFHCQPHTHGNTLHHRAPGALQGRERPGKVFKGKKMAGKTGNESATQFSCKVIRIDNERSLLFVKGPVPGAIGGMLKLRDGLKKQIKQKNVRNPIDQGVITYEGAKEDPNEVYEHDNTGVAGPDNEDE